MNDAFEVLEKRMVRIERQNRRLKYWGVVLVAFACAAVAWGRAEGNPPIQAQRFELRDEAGRLRAELSMLNGEPALRFFDKEGSNGGSLLNADAFVIFKKGGSDSDIQAAFAADGLSFEGDYNQEFVSLRADREGQTGKLQLNDYRHKVYAGVSPVDLLKLQFKKAD